MLGDDGEAGAAGEVIVLVEPGGGNLAIGVFDLDHGMAAELGIFWRVGMGDGCLERVYILGMGAVVGGRLVVTVGEGGR